MIGYPAPESSYRIIFDDAHPAFGCGYDWMRTHVDVQPQEDLIKLCEHYHIKVPTFEIDDELTIMICFHSDEDAVFFELIWEKGCDSI